MATYKRLLGLIRPYIQMTDVSQKTSPIYFWNNSAKINRV